MTVGTQVEMVMVERETGEVVTTPAEVDTDTGGGTTVEYGGEAGVLVLAYTGAELEVTTTG